MFVTRLQYRKCGLLLIDHVVVLLLQSTLTGTSNVKPTNGMARREGLCSGPVLKSTADLCVANWSRILL